MSQRIYAPFTIEQVASLREYQKCEWWHPFTCCGRPMMVTTRGWWCDRCGEDQDWAHDFMGDWSWKQVSEEFARALNKYASSRSPA